MAASVQDLKLYLQNHSISQILRNNLTKESQHVLSNDAKGLVLVDGCSLYVWNSYDACILHCTLAMGASTNKSVLDRNSKDFQTDNTYYNSNVAVTDVDTNLSKTYANGDAYTFSHNSTIKQKYQRLVCSNPPKFDVTHILLSPTGDQIAMYGPQGVTVLHVPCRKSRFGEFDNGKESIICRSINLSEYELSRQHNSRVLQVAWHPGSEGGSHLAVLVSDNLLYIYDILQPSAAPETLSLGASTHSAPAVSAFDTALGDVAVSFDFGASVTLCRRAKRFSETSQADEEYPVWPVYVLKGNGDVLIAYSCLSPARKLQIPTVGPLAMYPPAEDNYGTDACSILSLRSDPQVVVIATCGGSLYHCVVLEGQENDGDSVQFDRTQSPSIHGYSQPKPLSLYVYEVIELEFSLITPAPYSDAIDDFAYPVRLTNDLYSTDRYHCCHSAGVHTVALLWLPALEHYIQAECNREAGGFSLNQSSLVEHLICTKPLPTSPTSPVQGLAFLSSHNLGICLVALTADMTFELLPLSTRYRNAELPLLSNSPRKGAHSPLRRLRNEPFHQHIEKILRRSASNPILRSSQTSGLSQQECFELLTRATHFFRAEYLLKQDLARENIEKRIRILRDQKQQQDSDLKLLDSSRDQLRDCAERVADKYEDIKIVQQNTLERIRVVVRKIQSQVPMLSQAEQKMHRDLCRMAEKLDTYSLQIKHVKMKYSHQKERMEQPTATPSLSLINLKQSQNLRTVIKQQSDDIAQLVNSINHLKMDSTF